LGAAQEVRVLERESTTRGKQLVDATYVTSFLLLSLRTFGWAQTPNHPRAADAREELDGTKIERSHGEYTQGLSRCQAAAWQTRVGKRKIASIAKN
jgi:hypothetical protein